MKRYVLDTNVLIASVPMNSPHHWIWDALAHKEFTLCVTTEILHEYEEVLSRFFSKGYAQFIMSLLDEMPNIEHITTYFRWNLITIDPDDNKFVDCAISANAQFIVSEDKHFKVLKKIDFPKVQAIKIAAFKILMAK